MSTCKVAWLRPHARRAPPRRGMDDCVPNTRGQKRNREREVVCNFDRPLVGPVAVDWYLHNDFLFWVCCCTLPDVPCQGKPLYRGEGVSRKPLVAPAAVPPRPPARPPPPVAPSSDVGPFPQASAHFCQPPVFQACLCVVLKGLCASEFGNARSAACLPPRGRRGHGMSPAHWAFSS